jgi:hypothetical protein
MTSKPTATADKKEEPKDQKVEKTGQLGALEEDDEFEEFEAEGILINLCNKTLQSNTSCI